MYYSHHEIVQNQLVEGIEIKVTRRDDSLLMTEFSLQKGAKLPEHVHLSDHSAYLLSGKILLVIDDVAREMVQGDSWCLGKHICHRTEALEDSVVIEVFYSVPEESHHFLPEKVLAD
jgi:quercetin dioxygenase-like cupin family protein